VVFNFASVMTRTSVDVLASRADNQAQYAGSGAPSMAAFLEQDILAAACAHLVINAALGLAGAGLAMIGSLAVCGPKS
jgi:hypothetical protein